MSGNVVALALALLLQQQQLAAAVPTAVDGTASLRLSVNGLLLADRPFLDHSQQWPPVLTWTLHGGANDLDMQQAAFAVQVDGASVGGLASATMRHVLPAPARSNRAHAVSVTVTLADGRTVTGSGEFRTALLGEGFGNASWISGGTLLQRNLADLAHPSSSSAKVVNATAFASGVGCFAIKIDNEPVSSSFMDPGWATLPTARVTYRAYDLTSRFTSDEPPKQMRVSLGMCKYGYQGSFCVGAHAANGACKAFLLSLHVTYSDGTVAVVESSATDGTWEATTAANPIRYSHLYHGEQFDGRVVDRPDQWSPAREAVFDTGEGGGAVSAGKALGSPVLLTMPPLEASEKYTPVSVKRVGESTDTLPASHAEVGLALSFVRCVDAKNPALCGNEIWYEDAATKTRYHVPQCQMCGISPCSAVKTVTSAAIAALHQGLSEFNCSMVPGAPSQGHKWVFDMGDNQAGFATLRLPRSALSPNRSVSLKYAEVLKSDGSVNMAWCAEAPACKCSGINCANQTDTFFPAPPSTSGNIDDDEFVTYTPSFTYHGYRYVQIEGLMDNYTPTVSDLTGLFIHSAVKRTGNVSFSHPVLDGVQKAIVQTQLSNLYFHPTDCPQREKRGWTGDAQFTSRQASLNFDMRQLYGNWLQTMQDHDDVGCALNGATPVFPQTNKDICCTPKHNSFGCDFTSIPNGTFTDTRGSVADVVPFMYVGGWPGDPSWGSISSILPYTVWKGGDDALVDTYYAGAKRNVDFFLRESAADGLIEFGFYGDWLSLPDGHTDKPQVVSTAQIMATSHLVEMAAHLGKAAEAESYNATLSKMKLAYHAKYWDKEAASYKGGSQTANLMPLILGIPPPAEKALAAASFVANVEAKGNATSSGLVGASFVLQALVLAGRGDIALAMAMREEMPSWGWMVKQGPGTIWESWDDTTNSHNHPMFTASIGPYLYSIVGLDPSTWSIPSYLRNGNPHNARNNDGAQETASAQQAGQVGVVTMHVTPDSHAVHLLGKASGKIKTMCGDVVVAWQHAPGQHFAMSAQIPHNCGRARLVLHVPASIAVSSLCVGDYNVADTTTETSPHQLQGLPTNVFHVEMGADRKTVDVVVGGGPTELKLQACL